MRSIVCASLISDTMRISWWHWGHSSGSFRTVAEILLAGHTPREQLRRRLAGGAIHPRRPAAAIAAKAAADRITGFAGQYRTEPMEYVVLALQVGAGGNSQPGVSGIIQAGIVVLSQIDIPHTQRALQVPAAVHRAAHRFHIRHIEG